MSISIFRKGREERGSPVEMVCAYRGTPQLSLVQTAFCKSNHCMQIGEEELEPFQPQGQSHASSGSA